MQRIGIHIFSISLLNPLAALLWAQGTYTATSCNQSAVNALINGPTHTAVDGDTINIPAGTCTWTSQLSVTKGISIIGAGSSSTIIQDGYAGGTLLSITLSSASQVFRLSSMSLNAGGALPGQPSLANIAGTCNTSTCAHIRLDHVNSTGWVNGTSFQGFLIYTNNVFGVLDHWTVVYGSGGEFIGIGHSSFLGVGDNGDNSWAQPDFHGTDNFLYIEDSSFTSTGSVGMVITDTDGGGNGGRFVGRFNTMHNAYYQTHGTESGGRGRSGRVYEVYNNNLTMDSGFADTFMGWRGGTGFLFNNTKTGSGNMYLGVSLTYLREGTSFYPWGNCNGQGPYDQNDGVVYDSGTFTAVNNTNNTWTDSTKSWTANQWLGYSVVDVTLNESGVGGAGHGVNYHPGSSISSDTSNTLTSSVYNGWSGTSEPPLNVGDSYQILRALTCIDAPGRGGAGATLLSDYYNPTPTGWVNQPLDPVYEWGDTASGPVGPWVGVNRAAVRLVENRDYYQQASPFTGASGTGTGALANRPSTCTTGVAYWATDQGNWNQSGSGGQGQLYICTSTNTWTLSYTPYTYPHPLTGGGITTPPAPPRPTAPSSLQTVVH